MPLDARTAEALRPGDLVFFGTRPEAAVRPVDRRIVEVAGTKGGVYALDPNGDAADRDRTARRLRELERQGRVSANGPNRWSVRGDLVEQLETRARTQPRPERLWVEKVPTSLDDAPGYRGPSWLDQVRGGALASWGFGAEVGRALDRRRDALRALGIPPDDPQRDAKLQELERRAVGEGMALRTRQQFLAKTPDGFRGRLQAGPDGAPYAVVTDGTRFVLVPASRQVRALAGQTVVVSRDSQGRLAIRAPDRDRDR